MKYPKTAWDYLESIEQIISASDIVMDGTRRFYGSNGFAVLKQISGKGNMNKLMSVDL